MSKSKVRRLHPMVWLPSLARTRCVPMKCSSATLRPATLWQVDGLAGTYRWSTCIWNLLLEPAPDKPLPSVSDEQIKTLRRSLHQTIKKVEDDIDGFGVQHGHFGVDAVHQRDGARQRDDEISRRGR